MVTKQADLQLKKQIQFKIRQLNVRQASIEEDYQGADVFLNSLAIAHRLRSLNLLEYEEITIRKRDKSDSEYEKILNDACLAELWIFEYEDAYILVSTTDIKARLLQGRFHYIHNKSEPNGFYCLHISQIPHLRIEKL